MNPVGVHAQHVGARGFYGYGRRSEFGKTVFRRFWQIQICHPIPREAPGGVEVHRCDPPGGGPRKWPKKRHLVLYKLAGFCDSAKIAWGRFFCQIGPKMTSSRPPPATPKLPIPVRLTPVTGRSCVPSDRIGSLNVLEETLIQPIRSPAPALTANRFR